VAEQGRSVEVVVEAVADRLAEVKAGVAGAAVAATRRVEGASGFGGHEGVEEVMEVVLVYGLHPTEDEVSTRRGVDEEGRVAGYGSPERPREQPRTLNLAMHNGQGALVGLLRAVMANTGLRGSVASGMFTVGRLSSDQVLENATGVGAPPQTWPRRELAVDILYKSVYGFVTGRSPTLWPPATDPDPDSGTPPGPVLRRRSRPPLTGRTRQAPPHLDRRRAGSYRAALVFPRMPASAP
jgi:hypothetical protein